MDWHQIEDLKLISRLTAIYYPDLYKICEGCDEIVARNFAICPFCNAYRFDEDSKGMLNKVKSIITGKK